jgi:hypothetical protein
MSADDVYDLPEHVVDFDTIPSWAREGFEWCETSGTWQLSSSAKQTIAACRTELAALENELAAEHAAERAEHEQTRKALHERQIDHAVADALERAGVTTKTKDAAKAFFKSITKLVAEGDEVAVDSDGVKLDLSAAVEKFLDSEGSPFSRPKPATRENKFSSRIAQLTK